MHRIDGDAHVSNMFDGGDPGVPRLPTEVTPKWLNAVQEELANTCESLGVTLDDGEDDQLLLALFGVPSSGSYAKQSLTRVGSWVNTSGPGPVIKGRLTPGGIVQLEGEAVHPTGGNSTILCVLPTALRPLRNVNCLAWYFHGSTEDFCRVAVNTDGEVYILGLNNGDAPNTISLDNVAFSL